MTDKDLIAGVLKEYASRLDLNGSSIVLVPDQSIADAVEESCKKLYLSYLPAITINESTGTAWAHKEGTFTHIISELSTLDKSGLQHLKWIQWSLKYKGVLLLVLDRGIEEPVANIIDFIENASFERGRIRCLKHIVNQEDEQVNRTVVLAMKWDLLCA